MALKKCVDAHPEYYGNLSQPAKEEAEQSQEPQEPTSATSELVSPDTEVPQTNPEEPSTESA